MKIKVTIECDEVGLAPLVRNYEIVDGDTSAIGEGAEEMVDTILESFVEISNDIEDKSVAIAMDDDSDEEVDKVILERGEFERF